MHPAHKRAVRKGCVLAFFSVVASYSNLSTYRFSGGKDKKEILYLRYR